MSKSGLIYVVIVVLVVVMSGCGATKRVPHGSYLMSKNKVAVDKAAPYSERIKADKVERFIKPQPNRKFLGTNLYLGLHNMASGDTTKKGWVNRTLRKWGEAPVLLDTLLVEQSREFINNYTIYAGFYDSQVSYQIDTTKRRKASVTYSIVQKTPYRIGSVKYEFRDQFLRAIVMEDSAQTLIKSGNIVDGNVLSSEKMRITEYLKDRGYYDFTLNNIEFVGDSTVGNHLVDLTIVFKQYLAGYDSQGMPVFENNSIYRIGEIYVNPDYDPTKLAAQADYYKNMDTINFRGLNVVTPSGVRPKVRSKILRKSINIYPNDLYSSAEVQQTSNNIIRLGYYKNVGIIFDPMQRDSTMSNEVTYIGGDGGESETTTEKYMICNINAIPALKQSYKVELEGSTSSNFNAISATLGYQNRNLFRGVELFDVSVKGGYEFIRVKGQKGSFEVGGAVSMQFPRFISPFYVDPRGRRVNPRTKIEMSINSQRRPNYHRTISSFTLGYSWSNKHKSSFILRPIDLNLVKMGYVNKEWRDNIKNEYLRHSYDPRLIPGISGQFVYNQQMGKPKSSKGNSMIFRLNWETAGNLFYVASNLFGAKKKMSSDGREHYHVFGTPYAQYVRFDASLSNKIHFAPKVNIAYRFYAGAGLSYGNANNIPFDRLFYGGGSNSMRGWIPRTLGPGNVIPDENSRKYPNQTGNMKLEANAEFRFPVWGMLNSAIFFDVGNIWFIKEGTTQDETAAFRLDRFYRQLGFNTGLGFRIDIGMAVIRLDWGMRVHDPNLEKGQRWIKSFKFSNTVLNFGVGYPF